MIDQDTFEQLFVDAVVDHVNKLGLSHSEFARRVWGPTGPRVWRFIRKPQGGGKPRRVTVGEGMQMAQVLGLEYPYLILLVCQLYAQEPNNP